jgi:diguanylate cyclase (GGDEF)-like protein/PAS domain S-box-containing protein
MPPRGGRTHTPHVVGNATPEGGGDAAGWLAAPVGGAAPQAGVLAARIRGVPLCTDLRGRVVGVPARLRWLTGRDPEDVLDRGVAELFDDRYGPAVLQLVLAVGAGGETWDAAVEARLAGGDEHPTWVEVTAAAQRDADGRPRDVLVLLHDVSARHRATSQNRLFRAVTDASPVGIFGLDGDRWTVANPRLADLTGLDEAALRRGELWDLIHPEDRPQLAFDRSTWPLARRTGRPASGSYRIIRPDGEERWIRLQVSPVQDGGEDGGDDVWAGTVEDTTNEVTSRQHSALLTTIVSAGTDLVAILSPAGRVRFLNPAGRALLGLARSESAHRLHADRIFGEAGWASLRDRAIPAATDGGTWSGESDVLAGDGTAVPVSVALVVHRDAMGRIDRVSVVARDASAEKAVQQRLAAEAAQDPLTGLANRAGFHDAVAAALTATAEGRGVGVLFCDLDRFKPVNDSLGHDAGDQLLRIVAERLSGVLRSGDLAARIGGDEFLVLVADLDGDAELHALAERVREVLHQPVHLDLEHGTAEVRLTFSIGGAVARAGDAPASLIARADEAMYRAKRLGKDRVELFDAALPHHPRTSLVAEQALRRALDQHELRLLVQPIVTLPDRRIVGAEALVRWQHPELGVLPPADFITLAEDTGLIGRLGAWVLAESVGHAARWAADPATAGLRVHVNVSGRQLVVGDVVELVAREVRRAHLPAGTLCLELNEAALAPDTSGPGDRLAALRALGVAVAIDDFGAGTSSLGQLRRHPVDLLKLDASLVTGIVRSRTDAAIVTSLQQLAAALDIATIAVGVEEEVQARALQAMGCRLAQGYLFAEPMSPAAFEAELRARRGGAVIPPTTSRP